MKRWWILKFFKGFLFFALAILLFGLVVMGLWNSLLPDITGVRAITFFEAVGLLVLARIFFGGWGWWGRRGGHHPSSRQHYYRKKWEEKLANMSPEEREKFKQQWRYKCGGGRWGKYEEKKDESNSDSGATEPKVG